MDMSCSACGGDHRTGDCPDRRATLIYACLHCGFRGPVVEATGERWDCPTCGWHYWFYNDGTPVIAGSAPLTLPVLELRAGDVLVQEIEANVHGHLRLRWPVLRVERDGKVIWPC